MQNIISLSQHYGSLCNYVMQEIRQIKFTFFRNFLNTLHLRGPVHSVNLIAAYEMSIWAKCLDHDIPRRLLVSGCLIKACTEKAQRRK